MATTGQVRFTTKAKDEIGCLGAPFDRDACLQVLLSLRPDDFRQRVWSDQSCESLYVFRAWAHGVNLYVTLVLRHECFVISFHAEEGDHAD
jgi:hypothetical protein